MWYILQFKTHRKKSIGWHGRCLNDKTIWLLFLASDSLWWLYVLFCKGEYLRNLLNVSSVVCSSDNKQIIHWIASSLKLLLSRLVIVEEKFNARWWIWSQHISPTLHGIQSRKCRTHLLEMSVCCSQASSQQVFQLNVSLGELKIPKQASYVPV